MALLVLLGGCGKEPTSPTILEANNNRYVSDLPLPKQFVLDERQSEYTVVAGRRSVKHLYHGQHTLQAVKNFYQQYMPLSNWELLEDTLKNGVYLLKYRKGEERCEIRIERMPTGGLGGTITQIRATIQSMYAEAPA